ncbi:YdcF family protein [Falsibacillus albus]|uniref:YdcF family protein n=1 Tax=Falsibacillus albus TaxID=2478915 RepID=A0A3L7K3G8_9BACI|nr:YdcF family protein [Falsibacillus albus]RLQ96854.1 YdcF family protein [Falsibacillus albus]
MLYLIKFLYSFFLPPGIFVLILLGLSIWFYRKKNRTASSAFFVCSLLFYIFSTPWLGEKIIHQLEYKYTQPKQVNGDVLVMLGGGAVLAPDIGGSGILTDSATNRLITTARLYKKTHLPIIVSGGEVYPDNGNEGEITKRQLLDLGVPADKIIIDNKSLNTEQNAFYTKKLLDQHQFKRPVLITSAFHMKRAVLCFTQEDVEVQPFPCDYRTSAKPPVYANKFTPGNFEDISLAAKEYLGAFVLKVKGIL